MPFEKGNKFGDGRPKGAKGKFKQSMFEELLQAAKKVEKNEKISGGKSIVEHFCERCYRSDTVLSAFMKKLVADRSFNINEFQGEGIKKIVFEIVDAKSPKNDKESDKKKLTELPKKEPDNNRNNNPSS